MRGITNTVIPEELRERNEGSLANVIRHVKAHGLESKRAGYKGREAPYTTYKAFAKDKNAETVFAYNGADAYVQFVQMFGDSAWAEDARADWEAERGGGDDE
jgi:hypothetical protein